ncbi:toxin subunit, partial [Fusarium mundagurra]
MADVNLLNCVFTGLPELSSKVKNHIETKEVSFYAASQAIFQQASLTLPETRRLLFIQTCYKKLASEDVDFCNSLLTNYAPKLAAEHGSPEGESKVLSQMGLDLYYAQNPGTTCLKKRDKFREALWTKVPLTVILATLKAGKLLVAHDSNLRAAVEGFLSAAIDNNLSLVSAEFRAVIFETSFYEKYKQKDKNGSLMPVDPTTIHKKLLDIYRLHNLVTNPLHIDILLRTQLCSARDIAILQRDIFMTIISSANSKSTQLHKMNPELPLVIIEDDAAARLHDHATAIDFRNQETWVRILDGLKKDFRAIDYQIVKKDDKSPEPDGEKKESDSKTSNQEDLLARKHYNMTDIFDLQSSPCEECCSVTSAAAYFHDCLLFLKSTPQVSPIPESEVSKPTTDTALTGPATPSPEAEGITTSVKALTRAGAPEEDLESDETLNLLDLLASRRPDLQHLQLSCANSTTMLPYVAIVNEVMASYIASDGKNISVTNCDLEQGHMPAQSLTERQDSSLTISNVFAEKLSGTMFPLDVFPYDHSHHAIKTYLGALGLTYSDVLWTFRSEARIVAGVQGGTASFPPGDNSAVDVLFSEASIVWERAAAADTLGLQAEEVSAIAREAIYTQSLMNLALGLRTKAVAMPDKSKVRDSWENWGYKNLAEMVDLDEDNATGLSFIRTQLLPRSGLSFTELLQICDSLFFGRRLVITNAKRNKNFTGQISEMRLLALDRAAKPETPALGPLTDQLCHELQAFVRLKTRLGWTIPRLDAVLSAIIENHNTIGKMKSASDGFSIDILSDLAHIITLSRLTNQPIESLLPLWTAAISTHRGKDSLYYRVFQGPGMTLAGDDVFKPERQESLIDGLRYFARTSLVRDHLSALATTLRRNHHELDLLLATIGIKKDGPQRLTMEILTRLYRHNVMCTLVGATPAEYTKILALQPTGLDLFKDQKTTLEFVRTWKQLQEAGWTIDEILKSLSQTTNGSLALPVSDTLALVSGLKQKITELELLWRPREDQQIVREQDIADICGQLYDIATARDVLAFIEGTQIVTTKRSLSTPEGRSLAKLTNLPSNVQISIRPEKDSGFVDVTLTGVLSAEIKAFLLTPIESEVKEETAAHVLQGVADELELKSQAAYNALTTRLGELLTSEEEKNLKTLFMSDIRDGTHATKDNEAMTEADAALLIDEAQRQRRATFVRAALPTLRAKIVHDAIVSSIEASIGRGLEAPVLSMLLAAELTSISSNEGQKSAVKALEHVVSTPLDNDSIDIGFFSPITTDSYRFTLSVDRRAPKKDDEKAETTAPELSINGILLPLIQTSDKMTWESAPIVMITGQYYQISSSVPLNSPFARWSSSQSGLTPFEPPRMISQSTIAAVDRILNTVIQAARLVKKLGLSLEELKYITTFPSALIKLDLKAPSIAGLRALESYRGLRDTAVGKAGDGREAFIGLLAWLGNPTGVQTVVTLAAQIAKATGWDDSQISTAITLKYPGLPASIIISRFRNIAELTSLQAVLGISQRISLTPSQRRQASATPQPLQVLFQIATPTAPGQSKKNVKAAAGLQACLGKGASLDQCVRDMREAQRTAMVSYLLQKDYVRNLGIFDADGLFAHFLLDVQMGAQLEITRIKAAISSIQLFVQRCVLGQEPEAMKARIDQGKWAWMGRHSTWQAARKGFLYPENWIEPSLRDDKTPEFETFEAALLSKDLNWKTFAKAMRGYVQGLQPISDLDIVTYLREDTPEGTKMEVYHFFGRTRSAPFTFYHRTMRITRPGRGRVVWTPWIKMEMDTMIHETDWDGTSLNCRSGSYLVPVVHNNRLLLYLPQIMTRPLSQEEKQKLMESLPEDQQDPEDFSAMAKKKPHTGPGPFNWEVRMAWTELVDGVWSPKRVSQSQLIVNWSLPPKEDKTTKKRAWSGLPSIANFVFAAETTRSDVKIRVAYQRAGQTTESPPTLHPVGTFAMSEERVVVSKITAQNEKLGSAIATSFHKFSWDAQPDDAKSGAPIEAPSDSIYSYITEADAPPLLAIRKQTVSRNLTWTMSFAANNQGLGHATGLVVDEKTGGTSSADGRSVFMYLKNESEAEKGVTSGTMYHMSESEVIEHSSARTLMEAICQRDDISSIDTLFTSMDKNLKDNHDWGKNVVDKGVSNYHELATAYALYNWEMGLHAVLLAVDRFHSTQQYELAIRAARLVFDPTAIPPVGADTADKKAAACWQFAPFRDLAMDKAEMADKFNGWPDDSFVDIAVTERRGRPWTAHSTARGRPQAYMKWIVMKYIEILIAAGDVYFRQGSMETLPLAIQRYIEAVHVLGPEPPAVASLAKGDVQTFDSLPNVGAILDLELAFPFMCEVEKRGAKAKGKEEASMPSLLSTTYFALPPNPKYASLRTLVKDRLFKARNNLDMNGQPIIYSMMEPALDPSSVMNAIVGGSQGSGGLVSILNDVDCPMPYQRFSALLTKALELCSEARSIGEQFLVAREKQDVEALSLLKARQDSMRQRMLMDIKSLQRDEINRTIESLTQNRDAAVAHLRYLLRLTGDPQSSIPEKESMAWEDIEQAIDEPTSNFLRMSPYENGEIIAASVATTIKTVAAGMETVIGCLRAVPEVTSNAQPLGVGVSVKADASNISRLTKGILGSLKIASMISSDVSSAFSRVSGLTRQLQERRMQANAKGREIKNIDKQLEIQKIRLDLNARETEIQVKDLANAEETETWLRTKYTNDRLYAWLEGQLRTLHFDMYTLAADMCRRAERAFRFERGAQMPVTFMRAGGYWDSNRDGILAAQQLSLDLRRMESAFLSMPSHDVELVKNVSLRQLDPQALLSLRENGTATFSLPEMLFDLDFPGHYMRRLRSVGVSIPCIVGPHATLAATLSITQNSYRVSAAASTPEAYMAASISDGSFRADAVPIAGVALSSGIQDTGTFDLTFGAPSDGRYGPFEGAGAISSWRLELPAKSVQAFNYDTISDVILHLRYTAVNGGPLLKRAAAGAVESLRNKKEGLGARDGFWGFLEARHDLGFEWARFKSVLSQTSIKRTGTLDLSSLASRLPFWARTANVRLESLTVALSTQDSDIKDDLSLKAVGVVKDAKGKQQQMWAKT